MIADAVRVDPVTDAAIAGLSDAEVAADTDEAGAALAERRALAVYLLEEMP